MTNQEALDLLALFASRYVSQDDCEDLVVVARECRIKLQELVSKAEPTRVNKNKSRKSFGLCNTCENEIFSQEDYCGDCGQAIDWSEDE